MCGAMWDGKLQRHPITPAVGSGRFETLEGNGRHGAGICALLFAIRISPRFPVTSGRHLDGQAYCGTTAQHTAQGTCVQLSANRAARPAPSFVSAMLPNLK